MTSESTKRIAYIQGLRALSVVLVLLYHIDPTWLPSGYLGVDAFFAISGYVITRLILRRLARHEFDLITFYRQRINRLLPPLFIVIVATVTGFYFLYGINDLIAVYASSIFATLSLANVYYFMDAGYFSEASIHKPLLHTWSLGVEEQFYLIWPVIIVFLVKRRWHRWYAVIASAFLLLFVTAIVVQKHFDLVFYMMPFRGYQLMFGAGLALLAHERANASRENGFWFLSLLPVLVVALSVAPYKAGTHQFYAQALTALLVATGCFYSERYLTLTKGNGFSHFIPQRLFSARFVQYLGARSYLIYLVHWPIIVALHHTGGEQFTVSLPLKAAALIATLLGAELLHHLAGIRRIIIAGFVAVLLPAFLLLSVVNKSSDDNITLLNTLLPDNAFVIEQDTLSDDSRQRRLASCRFNLVRDRVPTSADMQKCIGGDKKSVLVMGDSFAGDFMRVLINRYSDEFKIQSVLFGGCPPYFGNDPDDLELQKRVGSCVKHGTGLWRQVFEETLIETRFDIIVVAGNWLGGSVSTATLKNSLEALNSLGQPIIFVGPRPVYYDSVVRIAENGEISSPDAQLQQYLRGNQTSTPSKKNNNETYRDAIYELSKEFSNVKYFNIHDALCSSDCPAYDNGELIYKDHAHLSKVGIRYLARKDLLDKVFK